MGHGKETPRQKMIGMMYLVLTAMLAMNVSAEVLDAFVLVEDGLTQTAKNFKIETESSYVEFQKAASLNAKKAGKWLEKSKLVRKESEELHRYIQGLKIEVVKRGDGPNAEAIKDNVIDAEKIQAKGNLDVGSQMFIGPNNKGEAQVLKEKLNSYKDFLIGLIEEKDRSKYEKLIETIERNLSTEAPEVSAEEDAIKKKTWEHSRFDHIPLIALLPQLSSIQVNVINSESEILGYLLGQIDEGSFSFNVITANVIPTSSYVIKGNRYSSEISMAAYDSTQSPKIMVGKYHVDVDGDGNEVFRMVGKEGVDYKVLTVENGKAMYDVPASRVGTIKYQGLIEMQRPDGSTMRKPFNQEYQVAEPNVVVSPEKMNVFYRGVDNPVSVSVAGVSESNVEASVSSGTQRKIGSTYIIKPGKGSVCKVSVYARIDNKRQLIDTKNFRVKPVPDPFASVRGVKGKKVSRMDLVRSKGIAVKMPEWFDFDLRFSVISFKIATVRGGMINELSNRGANFSQQQKNLIKGIKKGGKLFVENIKVKGPDGETREINDIVLTVN